MNEVDATRFPVAAPTEGAGRRAAPFVVLASAEEARPESPGPARRVLVPLVAALAAVVVAIALGAVAARNVAEREAVRDASERADLLAKVLAPVLTDQVLAGDTVARQRLDRVVKRQVLGPYVLRVKIWAANGLVVYSDESRLSGQRLTLSADEREALADERTRAEVTDLSEPENRYERGRGKLLEVYRRVNVTPSGTPLLFEIYAPYQDVTLRSQRVWRSFAALLVGTVLLLLLLLLPVLWRLQDRLRRSQAGREALLRRAVDASLTERRRIAGTLHDGVVQELAATSFALAGSAERAQRDNAPELAEQLRETAATVRGSIGGLRSLLVDIYPPSLASAGLGVALEDLAGPLRARDVRVQLDLPAAVYSHHLEPEVERLVFRIANECLVNVAKHAVASSVLVRLHRDGDEVVLDVVDDGVGFDVAAVTSAQGADSLGMRVMTDLARDAGATLAVASAPEEGTWWQLRIRAS